MIKQEQQAQHERQAFERRGYRMGYSPFDEGSMDYHNGPYDGANYDNEPFLSDQPYHNTAAAPQLSLGIIITLSYPYPV